MSNVAQINRRDEVRGNSPQKSGRVVSLVKLMTLRQLLRAMRSLTFFFRESCCCSSFLLRAYLRGNILQHRVQQRITDHFFGCHDMNWVVNAFYLFQILSVSRDPTDSRYLDCNVILIYLVLGSIAICYSSHIFSNIIGIK